MKKLLKKVLIIALSVIVGTFIIVIIAGLILNVLNINSEPTSTIINTAVVLFAFTTAMIILSTIIIVLEVRKKL